MSIEKFRKECEKIAGAYSKLLTKPPENIEADLAIPCFSLSREKKKSPVEIAESISEELNKKKKHFIKNIEAQGPYVNFYADWDALARITVKDILQRKKTPKKKEKVIVEFAHPNTHKLFHIGHLRNIITGESVARILESSGFDVVRANYQGDVGMHIAKCLWGINKIGFKTPQTLGDKIRFLGEAYAKGSKAFEEDEEAKNQIIEINRKIYEKDKSIEKLWSETRKWSLEYFDKIYRRVYTKFGRLFFESEVFGSGLDIAKNALKKGILKTSDGAIIFDGKKYDLDTRVFVNNLGVPTYEAKELGLAALEFSEFGKINKCIHVVGPEQSSFFKVTFKVEELLDKKFKDRQFHLVYGWVRLKKGKMSSRLGNVIEGEWLLDELKSDILEKYVQKQDYPESKKPEIAEKIAIGAAKYYFLKFNTASEIAFDMDEAISLEGNTGPYLQYTYARANSILSKSKKKPKPGCYGEEEMRLIKKMSSFQKVAQDAARDYKPHYIANYLFELASMFNEYYHETKVIGSDSEEKKLALVRAVTIVLRNGLNLLGIDVLEKM
jgi:arginyl-tRNA synthetase